MINADKSYLEKILNDYGKFIIHMRRQIKDKRFGLVLGAGASRDLGFPDWGKLITRISQHKDVDSFNLTSGTNGNSTATQLLYQKFKAKEREVLEKLAEDRLDTINTKINTKWKKIVHECLYEDVPDDLSEIKKKDHYLQCFIDVIKNTKLTINYNFDDTLQRFISDARTKEEKRTTRGYTTVWNDKIQIAPKDGVIYHPNGFLPRRLAEKPSEQLVFLEDTFADQLIASMSGYYATLSNHYTQNTCLFLGISLDDSTLKHLLRINANNFPGNYHYLISFYDNETDRSTDYEQAFSGSNFDVYNINTLFLCRKGIAALGTLLGMDDDEFNDLAAEVGVATSYRYFIVGSVCVGKTTSVSNFQSLVTHDEWLEDRPSGMDKAPEFIDPSTEKKIDDWVFDQIGKKNKVIQKDNSGIHIIDRAPLDAFAFSKDASDWKIKAKKILKSVSPGKSGKRLCRGHIIFLKGDPDTMEVRSLLKHKVYTKEALSEQQTKLLEVYSFTDVSFVDTKELSQSKVAKKIADVIFRQDYKECDMHQWLIEVEEK